MKPVTVGQRVHRFASLAWAWNLAKALAWLANLLTSCRFVVEGSSMEPTLLHGQHFLVSRRTYSRRSPARGDIVVAQESGQLGTDCIKRVIGLPGEHVRIEDGRVFINDHLMQELYLADGSWSAVDLLTHWVLGDDSYVLLGDNRIDSRDSRRFGSVRRCQIFGKAWIRYWPPDAWGRLSHREPSVFR